MDLKEFFVLGEMALHEMAGMPQDNPYNAFMYEKIMEEYGYKYNPAHAGAWPPRTSAETKIEDVQRWHNEAISQGIYPSKEVSARSVVAGLNWPFGNTTRSPGPSRNMRSLIVQVGFATQEQMDALVAKEGGEAPPAAGPQQAAAGMPKMGSVIRHKASEKMPPPPSAPAREPAPPKPDFDIDLDDAESSGGRYR